VTHPATLRSFTKSHPSSIESCRLEMSLLGRVLLNLGTVATIPKFSPPLSRLLEIRRLRSNICCSNMNLLQYHGQYCYSICVSTDPNRTIKTERLKSISDLLYIYGLNRTSKCRGPGLCLYQLCHCRQTLPLFSHWHPYLRPQDLQFQ
jgi:hypothetical protein